MFQCYKCKRGFSRMNHSTWRSGKDKGIVSVMVCATCYHKARTLKNYGCDNKNCCK